MSPWVYIPKVGVAHRCTRAGGHTEWITCLQLLCGQRERHAAGVGSVCDTSNSIIVRAVNGDDFVSIFAASRRKPPLPSPRCRRERSACKIPRVNASMHRRLTRTIRTFAMPVQRSSGTGKVKSAALSSSSVVALAQRNNLTYTTKTRTAVRVTVRSFYVWPLFLV